MAKLVWNQVGTRFHENGLDRGVLYPKVGPGVPWNGLVGVDSGSSGGEVESYYFNGVKYMDFVAAEDFQATIEAYSAPPEFLESDGTKQLAPGLYVTQQPRWTFGFSYRTHISSDVEENAGYKLHLIYNATASPTSNSSRTRTDKPDVNPKQWNINTVPPASSTFKPTAHLIIDSRDLDPYTLQDLEDHIYGSTTKTPSLPTQAEVIHILTNGVTEFVEAFV